MLGECGSFPFGYVGRRVSLKWCLSLRKQCNGYAIPVKYLRPCKKSLIMQYPVHTSLQRWRHASTSSWTTSGVGSHVQSSVMTGQGQAGMMTKMGHLTIAQIAWESTWDRKLPRRRDQITFGLTATAGVSCFFDQHQLHLVRNAADKEALAGKITYYPASRALPLSYFPFLVQPWSSFVIWGQQNAWSGSQEPKGTKGSWP